MIHAHSRRARAGAVALAALIVVATLPSLAGARSSVARKGTPLTPRLAELATPGAREAPAAAQAVRIGLPKRGPGSLLRVGNRILVEVRFEQGAAAAIDDLREAGARIVNVSRRYQAVTLAVRPATLPTIAAVPDVEEVAEVLTPQVAATECRGLATSEGDFQLDAAAARSVFAIDGGGVGVGILSDSFDRDTDAATHAAGDVVSGDLPGAGNPCGQATPVRVLDDSFAAPEATDEGRGMAQIVHDLAPGAALSFASAFSGEIGFAENIERLAAPVAAGGGGARVIADDVRYPGEPFFQDGPVAVAINRVTAGGASYFSAAGNENVIDDGSDVASYEASFRGAGACPLGVPPTETECMDFDPDEPTVDTTYELEVEPGANAVLELQWAEPWFGLKTNFDAYLLDSLGTVLDSSTNANKTRPFELVSRENTGSATEVVSLAIARHAGTESPVLKFVQIGEGASDVVPTSEQLESSAGDAIGPTIIGHTGAPAAISVGAVGFDDGSEPEPYSSRGPAVHYFGPVAGVSAAAALSPPQEISKPDIVATDCGRTTFFLPTASPGLFRFCGTSAAAPHAAAVAALLRQANPTLSVAQVRTALAATARAVGSFGPDAVGAGLIDAYSAVSSVALPPTISITERPEALSRNRQPSIGFSANRPVAFTCSLDGGALAPCSSPFVPAAPLADGLHGFVVQGTDAAGREGKSEQVDFEIDTRRPRTFFRKHPHKTILTRKRRARAVFRFGSNERGVTFACKIDAGFLRFCEPRLVRRFRVGQHVVSVKARDAAGNVDRSPAVFRFRVKRRG